MSLYVGMILTNRILDKDYAMSEIINDNLPKQTW